jgi:hypothetical protein
MHERNPLPSTTKATTMKLLKKRRFSTPLAATAVSALLAIGLASTALAAPVMVFQADLYGNRGNAAITGPIQSGWTGITGLNTAAPWTNPYSINGITIALSAAAGNTGWRNDRTQLTVPNVGPLAALYNSSVFAAGGFDLKMTGLTAGTTYNFILYATDTGNNVGDVHWNYSLAGDKTSPVDAGWVNQPGSTAFTPTANTGITQATKGIAMLSTTFTATGSAVDFFSLTGTVAVLSGFELYAVPASALAADAGADKTMSPTTPSVTIGANPTASGGTGPYTYLWSPSTGLSSDTLANPTAAPTTTTVYTVTVTDSLLATASDSVTVNYPLAANAGADKLCTPGSPSATIGAASTANGGTGPYTYSWTSDPAGFTSSDANPTVSPSETTTYTVQVTDALSAVSTDLVIVTYAVPDPNLISVDFVYSSGSTVASGNTVLTSPANPATDPNMKNAAGELYTGQVGPWNALNTGGNNANTTSASRTNLLDGSGVATTVAFKMGTATSLGGAGGGWRNSGLGTIIPGSLRQEQPYIYYPALTANHYNWELTGLDPGAHYRLTLFGNGGPTYTNIANSVAGVLDAEGDWNWADITANGSGAITGDYLYTASNNDVRGLYGLQLYKLAVPLVADAGLDRAVSAGLPSIEIGGSPTASGGTGPYTYLWSPSKDLDDATASNPIASPTSTTIYTVTVTDSLNATATDSVTVSFTTPPLVADAGPDKSLTPGAPSAKIGGNPSATGGFPSYTYSWTPATGLDDPMVANPTASPDSPTTYTLTVTDAQTTVATDTVTVDYPLVVSAGPDQIVTPDSPSVPIGGTPTTYGGTKELIFSWAPATGLDAANVANPIASPTTTTTYTLTVTDALGVVGTDEVTVTYAVPNPNLVSVDFVYAVGGSVAYSGDTTLTGTLNKNATGEIYTGQVGSWNAVNVGGNNANNTSASRTSLLNGAGISTTISFKMGTATAAGTTGGGWRNNFVAAFGNLRQEHSYLYSPALTADHYNWELSGLIPKAHYRLTLFGDGGGSYTNTANTVAGVLDAEGDWNWADLTADATGLIAGNFLTTGNNDIRGLYGLQLEFLSSSPGSAYDTWAALHAGGGTAGEDYNNDGVQNGIAYFMGMNGLATHPGVVGGSVTWPHANSVASYKVQTSNDLPLSGWTDVLPGDSRLHDTGLGGSVTYDLLPAEHGKLFVRMVVTP